MPSVVLYVLGVAFMSSVVDFKPLAVRFWRGFHVVSIVAVLYLVYSRLGFHAVGRIFLERLLFCLR